MRSLVTTYLLLLWILLSASLLRISWRCRGRSKEERQAVFQSDEFLVFICLFVVFVISVPVIIVGRMIYEIYRFVTLT